MTDFCPFCELLKAPQGYPTFIAEFDHSIAFLDFDQEEYLGGSLLILKDHYEHLHLSPISLQQAVIPELVELTTAILKTFGGTRANHMSLGNGIAHIHWYIVPRYSNDLNAGHGPIYKPNYKKLADSEYQEMATQIRTKLFTDTQYRSD